MAQAPLAFAERVKVALMGDLAHADPSVVQGQVDASYAQQERDRGASGRIYGSFAVRKMAPARMRLNPIAPVAVLWTKLRSIGEYDAARTR